MVESKQSPTKQTKQINPSSYNHERWIESSVFHAAVYQPCH